MLAPILKRFLKEPRFCIESEISSASSSALSGERARAQVAADGRLRADPGHHPAQLDEQAHLAVAGAAVHVYGGYQWSHTLRRRAGRLQSVHTGAPIGLEGLRDGIWYVEREIRALRSCGGSDSRRCRLASSTCSSRARTSWCTSQRSTLESSGENSHLLSKFFFPFS